MAIKRFTRKTKGFNAQVFVAKAIDYTTDATYALFIQNAPVGELGIFDANNALHTDAITSTESLFFAMRTTEGVKKSPLYKLTDLTSRKKLYVAPVKQVAYVGWNRTGGAINNPTIAAGQTFLVRVIETTEGYAPFPTWSYEYTTKPTDAIIDVMRALAKKINDPNAPEHSQNLQLVTAKVTADATYSNYSLTGTTPTLTVTNGSTDVVLGGTTPASDIAVNDYISFAPSSTPSDSVGDIYKVISIIGTGDGQIYRLDRPFTGATQTYSEAESEGTRVKKAATFVNVGLEFTTIDNDVTFRLAVDENMVDADITYSTTYTKSNGTYEQVLAMEKEGQVFNGDTAQNAQFAADFGQQDTFAVSGETYDFYHFDFLKAENGIAPKATTSHRGYVVVPVAKSAGNVDTTLNTLFGL